MEDLSSIEEKLQRARAILNQATQEIARSCLPCRSVDIGNIGEALASISDVQLAIYKQQPDLMPAYLKENSPHTDANREFGRILMQCHHLLSENNPVEAIALLEAFIAGSPGDSYIAMTNNEASRIKKLFGL